MTEKELPGDWEGGYGSRIGKGEDATYTRIFHNKEWGKDTVINEDWEILQEIDDENEQEEFIEEWCHGEEPEQWSQYPESVEVEVYHDSGQPYHHVVAYERRDYPEDHEYYGDAFNDGYPVNSSRHDTEDEALEAAYELMSDYAE